MKVTAAALSAAAFMGAFGGAAMAAETVTEAVTESISTNADDYVNGILAEAQAAASELVTVDENGEMTVKHAYGETIMPENPKKIIVLKLEDLALALDLDMTATRSFEGWYLEDQIKELGIGEVAVDEASDTVNFEQVLSYQPDLIIIRDSFDQSVYDQLSQIAPTIAFQLKDVNASFVAMGMALGKEEAALTRLEQHARMAAEAKAMLADVTEPVSMLRVMKKELRLYPATTNDMSSFLYDDLGLTPDPLAVEYDNSANLAISLETLPDITSRYMFVIAGYGSAGAEDDTAAKELFASTTSDPLWALIPAVQQDGVFEVDSRSWLQHGIIAEEMKYQDVVKALTGEDLADAETF